jgi:hypothetical protein
MSRVSDYSDRMTQDTSALRYRFSRDEFVRAWEAAAFDHRVELIEGEVWPVVIGDWHGATVGRIIPRLGCTGIEVTTSTLAAQESLPDPDCWVRREGAEPTGKVGSKLSTWDPTDVLLVVEISDETVLADLEIKARLYGSAGYPTYWVVTRDAIYEHTEPLPVGYRRRIEYHAGERIPLRYADVELPVDELIAA